MSGFATSQNCAYAIDHGVVTKSDSDIAGAGVILAFLLSAYITFGSVLLAYFTGQVDEELLNDVDTRIFGVKSTVSKHPRIHAAVRQAVLALSDQQVVTGIAILGAGFRRLRESIISVYHFQIVLYLAWMSSSVHLSALTILAIHWKKHPALRLWRVVGRLVLFVLLLIGLVPTLSNDWGIDYWPGMADGATGWGIPAVCFWGQMWDDGINPDAVFGSIVLVISYIWKMGGLFASARRTFHRWIRHPLEWLMESVLAYLARRHKRADRRSQLWLWLFRLAVAVYIPATTALECAASFSASLWVSALCLVFGTMQIQIPRKQNLDLTASIEDNYRGSGQLVPLILLVQPAGAVFEHLWKEDEEKTPTNQPQIDSLDMYRTNVDDNSDDIDDLQLCSMRSSLLSYMAEHKPVSIPQRTSTRTPILELLYSSRLFAGIVWLNHLSVLGTGIFLFYTDSLIVGNASTSNWLFILVAIGIDGVLSCAITFVFTPFSRLGSCR